jgi:hypothetical protein
MIAPKGGSSTLMKPMEIKPEPVAAPKKEESKPPKATATQVEDSDEKKVKLENCDEALDEDECAENNKKLQEKQKA